MPDGARFSCLRAAAVTLQRRSFRRLSALMLGSAALLPASELVLSDLRLAWSLQPTGFEYTLRDTDILDDGGASRSGSDDFDDAYRLEWRGLRHWAGAGSSRGLVAGVGAAGSWFTLGGGGDLQTLEGELWGGYAMALDEHWMLQGLLGTGLGYGWMELANPGTGTDLELDGLVWHVGAELACTYRVAHRWRLLGAVGWRHRQGDLAGDGLELELTNAGVQFTLGVSFILDPEPRRVE